MAEQDELDFHVDDKYHEHEGIAGYRKIHQYLLLDNHTYSVEQVRKSMKRNGLQSIAQTRKKFNKPGHLAEAFGNLLKDFKVTKSNQLWVTDFTYQKLQDGSFVYVCVIQDYFDKTIVAEQVSKNIDAQLAIDTLEIALRKIEKKRDVILHSDQGIQYRSKRFVSKCKTLGVIQSMSRIATPTDNALMEGFMGKLKNEKLKHNEYKNILQVSEEVRKYCYDYYNKTRVHQSLNYATPSYYRELNSKTA